MWKIECSRFSFPRFVSCKSVVVIRRWMRCSSKDISRTEIAHRVLVQFTLRQGVLSFPQCQDWPLQSTVLAIQHYSPTHCCPSIHLACYQGDNK